VAQAPEGLSWSVMEGDFEPFDELDPRARPPPHAAWYANAGCTYQQVEFLVSRVTRLGDQDAFCLFDHPRLDITPAAAAAWENPGQRSSVAAASIRFTTCWR